MKYKDMKNQRCGHLTVIRKSKRTNAKGQAHWVCMCDCGRYLTVRGDRLRNGTSTQCSACFGSGKTSRFLEGSGEENEHVTNI